ncbi:hypothetical protein FACS1894206_06120 [Deltaproteobacteria bacterium]|nr:hypothetical protein FACS1894206_06120 [Deltaproteobacteria bacterium]
MGKIAPRSKRNMVMRSLSDALDDFLASHGGKEHARLTQLWQHWGMVMGSDLADMAVPLGHKKDVLLVAAEDSMAAQDIAMQGGEILERVNAFMSANYFSRVQVELVMGRGNLSKPLAPLRKKPARYRVRRPENLGSLRGAFDSAPSIARCYEAYLRYFSRTKQN